MSASRSKSWRLALVPISLLAALLFPTLHLHLDYDHDGDAQMHQHTIIHADFLSASAQEHGHLDRENVAVGGRHFGDFSQSNLLTRTVHGDESRTVKLTLAPRFLAVDLEDSFLRLAPFARVSKQAHSPPSLEVYRTPKAPRSPPVIA